MPLIFKNKGCIYWKFCVESYAESVRLLSLMRKLRQKELLKNMTLRMNQMRLKNNKTLDNKTNTGLKKEEKVGFDYQSLYIRLKDYQNPN